MQNDGHSTSFSTATLIGVGKDGLSRQCCDQRTVTASHSLTLYYLYRYDRNEFASDVAKLGVLPNMKLSRHEWSLIRRRIPNRPRRFSQRFIFEQLKQRNRYRSIFRQMQRNPNQSNPLNCDIPAPIRVGTTVTAYNKRLRILHRGIVLFHDVRAHGYLVQFERKELGYEFCPDAEVASHGVPEVLVAANDSWLNGTSRMGNVRISEIGTMTYGTSRTTTSGKCSRPQIPDLIHSIR